MRIVGRVLNAGLALHRDAAHNFSGITSFLTHLTCLSNINLDHRLIFRNLFQRKKFWEGVNYRLPYAPPTVMSSRLMREFLRVLGAECPGAYAQ